MRKILPEKNLLIILLGSLFALLVVSVGLFFAGPQQKSSLQTPPPPPPAITQTENSPTPQMATLKPIGKSTDSGTATRVFVNDQFLLAVTAQLPDPPQGKFYQGWLVKKTPKSEFLLTGKMNKAGSNYSLTYTQTGDLSSYPGVVVTLEQKDDQKPETHVLEGSF